MHRPTKFHHYIFLLITQNILINFCNIDSTFAKKNIYLFSNLQFPRDIQIPTQKLKLRPDNQPDEDSQIKAF